ncbi:hypothetical protein OA48_14195 [Klebsiella variicola]|nr:hypothetical protein OA48_14195 [Klebsiella variicola]MDT7003413.1 hypothetical protein [Klebsiella variicola]MDT7026264.1 hypothetical protein [Klebsiella variicola]
MRGGAGNQPRAVHYPDGGRRGDGVAVAPGQGGLRRLRTRAPDLSARGGVIVENNHLFIAGGGGERGRHAGGAGAED